MTRGFQLVDVFGAGAFKGNPLGVVLDGTGLSIPEMQAITQWLNLSETTFLSPPTDPQADYKVRIFTLAHELPFAGHPTLGSCHAWLRAGAVPKDDDYIVQECGAGLIKIKRGERLAFSAPPLIRSGPLSPGHVALIADVLRIPLAEIVEAQWVSNGPSWAGVRLRDADAVRTVEPMRDVSALLADPTMLAAIGVIASADAEPIIDIGIVGLEPQGFDTAYELRAIFNNQHGALVEDPVTGSLNASIAMWMLGSGHVKAPYVAAQGSCIGRDGRIFIDRDDDGTIWVGGATQTMFEGVCGF